MTSSDAAALSVQPGLCTLESVIATSELERRPDRSTRREVETQAEMDLTLALAKSPHEFFQKLVDTVLKLSLAESAGISLLNAEKERFVWPAVAGGLVPFVGGGTPQNFGPCGTVLERNAPMLFVHPERYFGYLEPISPPLEEVLLIPFHVKGNAVGTIWAVIHSTGRHFQAEDRRLLQNLGAFASSAYKMLLDIGALDPLLAVKDGAGS